VIKNIVFDIGNVLAGFTWQDYLAGFGFPKETQERLAACTVQGPLWQELDHGVMSEQEVIAAFKQYDLTIADEIDLVFRDIRGILTRYDYAVPWMEELKNQGYRIFIISNIFAKMVRECEPVLDFLKLADGVIFSYQEKVIKPDSTIYRLFLKRFDLNPHECVFIDDQERNVNAARNIGIPGIIFESYNQAYNDLKKLLLSDVDYL
jgi:putative hydrolase of the HAD superfamily